MATNQGFKSLVPDRERIDAEFLAYWLAARTDYLQSLGTGATFKEISKAVVSKIGIPVPPLDEQKRIAEVLSVSGALREQNGRAVHQARSLIAAVFASMFGDPGDSSRRWPHARVGDLAAVITGNTPPRVDSTNYGTYLEWVKSDNLGGSSVYVGEAAECLSRAGAERSRTVGPGAVLVTCIAGTPASIGNLGLTDRRVAFNQQINAIVPDETDASFLYAQLRVGQRLVQAASTGGMKGMVSKSSLQRVELIAPPLYLQEEFAMKFDRIVELQAQLEARAIRLQDLFASLRHGAFAGVL